MIKVSNIIINCAIAYIGFLFGCAYNYDKVESIQTPCNVKIHTEVINTHKEDKHDELDLSMWKMIEYDHRNFYFTDNPTPNHFEEQMNYIWNERGCYAFLPGEFTFEEIYQLVMRTPYKEELSDLEKFSGIIENI
jgi:hypothetical protein